MAPSVHCYFGAHTEFACYWQCNQPSMFRLRCLQNLGFHIKATGLAAAAAAVGDKVWNQTQTSQNFTAVPVPHQAHLAAARSTHAPVLQPPKFSRTWLKLTFGFTSLFKPFFPSDSYF